MNKNKNKTPHIFIKDQKPPFYTTLHFLQTVICIIGWIWIGSFLGLWVLSNAYNGWIIGGLAAMWILLRKYEEYQFGEVREEIL